VTSPYAYETTAATDKERVAIKVFNPPNQKHAADKRFSNEMVFGEKVNHKNVVADLDRGVIELGPVRHPST
jgi:hypothetical protein